MKLIILEGPDGSGKTTLAKEQKHLEYIHFGAPPRGKLGAWYQYYDLLEGLWDHPRPGGVIIDRFIHGEMIYGPILRGGTDLTWGHIRMLERVLMGLSARLVICLPPLQIILQNWSRNLEHEAIKHEPQMWNIFTFYLRLLGNDLRMLPRSVYDYTARTQLTNPGPFKNEGPGIGMFAPGNTLLIGDEVNKKAGKDGWPFVAPGGSSLWLANLLEEAKIPEHRLYWINAKTDGEATDPRFIDLLQPEYVIAMGGKAREWCKKHRIGCSIVDHPQYHKRFRHGEPYPLIDMLR